MKEEIVYRYVEIMEKLLATLSRLNIIDDYCTDCGEFHPMDFVELSEFVRRCDLETESKD